jgi:hypothetical protein
MGTWEIKIRGTGMHDNGKPEDADALARKLVADLRAAGSTVREAGFSLTYTNTVDGKTVEMPAAPHCEGWTDLLTEPAPSGDITVKAEPGSGPPPPQ